MRTTGIIRRVDDLGRIVIPKEIRHTLLIKDGDPMELFIEDDGVVFKKYKAAKSSTDIIEEAIFFVEGDNEIDFEQRQKAISKLRKVLVLLKP